MLHYFYAFDFIILHKTQHHTILFVRSGILVRIISHANTEARRTRQEVSRSSYPTQIFNALTHNIYPEHPKVLRASEKYTTTSATLFFEFPEFPHPAVLQDKDRS